MASPENLKEVFNSKRMFGYLLPLIYVHFLIGIVFLVRKNC